MTKVIIAILAVSLIISIGSRYTTREKRIHHWFEKDSTMLRDFRFNAVRFHQEGGIELVDTAVVHFKDAADSVVLVKEFKRDRLYYDEVKNALLSENGKIYPLPKAGVNVQFIVSRPTYPGDTIPRVIGDTVYLPGN